MSKYNLTIAPDIMHGSLGGCKNRFVIRFIHPIRQMDTSGLA